MVIWFPSHSEEVTNYVSIWWCYDISHFNYLKWPTPYLVDAIYWNSIKKFCYTGIWRFIIDTHKSPPFNSNLGHLNKFHIVISFRYCIILLWASLSVSATSNVLRDTMLERKIIGYKHLFLHELWTWFGACCTNLGALASKKKHSLHLVKLCGSLKTGKVPDAIRTRNRPPGDLQSARLKR
jgi:hypothetical protein